MASLSVILARLAGLMPNAFTRYSIEAVPVVISGLLFGPLAGALTGFVADSVGCLFTPFGWNPLFSLPPVLYGAIPGLLRFLVTGERKPRFWKLLVLVLVPAVLGSWLWQSWALHFVYGGKTFGAFLVSRGIQFAVTAPLDALILWLLFKAGLFEALRLWPPADRPANDPDERKRP